MKKTILLLSLLTLTFICNAQSLDDKINKILDESKNISYSYSKTFEFESIKIEHHLGYIEIFYLWYIPYNRKQHMIGDITYINGDNQAISYYDNSKYLKTETYIRIHKLFIKYNKNHTYDKSVFDWD